MMLRRIAQISLAVSLLAAGGLAVNAVVAQTAGDSASPGGQSGSNPAYVMPKGGPFSPEKVAIPNARFIDAWSRSGHSAIASEAFAHWNEEGEIPPNCSVCHSGAGFRSFHGLDGSPKGLPEKPVAVGGVVDCDTCHNPGLASITEISLPSGVVHPVSNGEASCMTCHQGRTAGATVAKAIDGKDDDKPDAELRFINPHYALAGASWLGGYGASGFHYEGREYSGRFLHAKPVATCASCHDPHSLKVEEANCLTCHDTGNAADIRISRQSYDGSGDTKKGIASDISANSDRLMAMIKKYAADVAGKPIIYDGGQFPYFFADANGDGVIDQAEGRSVAYNAFTPRLLKAAYNWKFVNADKGIHVHNAPYALELLHDSMADLAVPTATDFEAIGLLR